MSDTTNQVEEPNASVNQPGAAPAKKPAPHPLLLVSGILSLMAGTFSLFSLSYIPDLIEWAQSPDNAVPLTTWSYLLVFVLTPVLAYGAAYLAIIKRDLKMHAIAATAAYLVPAIIAVILEVIYVSVSYGLEELDVASLLRNFAPVDEAPIVEAMGIIALILSVVLAWIAVLVIKNSNSSKSVTNQFGGTTNMTNQQPIGYDPQTGAPIYGQPAQAQPVGYDPQTGAPIYGQPAYMRPESPLPLIALLGGIFFPLLGIIVGHIALGQMKRGEIPSSNMSLAKTGLILGYVFTALGILAVVVYIALFAAIVGPGLYY
jgi:hypothetical protein